MHDRQYARRIIRRICGRGGFTTAELMVGAAIGSLVLAGIVSSYLFALKGFRAISHYVEIHRDGRRAVDRFSQDMRAVSGVNSFSATNLVVRIPTAFNPTTGTVISNKTVTYAMSGGALRRTDSSTGKMTVLATNIYQMTFHVYDKFGSNTTVLSNAKGVQVNIRLRKYVIGTVQSEDYLSARLDMRNIP